MNGWFFGFTLHLVINEIGEIQALTLTKGNVVDRKPVPNLTKKLTGLLLRDKGYIKKDLFPELFDRGLKLVYWHIFPLSVKCLFYSKFRQ